MVFSTGVAFAAQNLQSHLEAKLSFVPYESSYLASRDGRIFERVSSRGRGLVSNSLEPGLHKFIHSDERSVAARFDASRQLVLGSSDLIEPRLRVTHFKPDAPYWEGFCHQWSMASLNPGVNEILSRSDGLLCGNTVLTQGELKELFTAFYATGSDSPHLSIIGGRLSHKTPMKWNKLRRLVGADDVPAHRLHTALYERLLNNKGIVLDGSASPDVWNFPVYKAASDFERYDSAFELRDLARVTPPTAFFSDDDKIQKRLMNLQSLRGLLEKANNGIADQETYRRLVKEFDPATSLFASAPTYLNLAKAYAKKKNTPELGFEPRSPEGPGLAISP